MRFRARVDSNQKIIAEAFRKCGYSVAHLHQVGSGCPDLVVGKGGITTLVEVKGAKGELTEHQEKFHADWRGSPIQIVRTVEEVLALNLKNTLT